MGDASESLVNKRCHPVSPKGSMRSQAELLHALTSHQITSAELVSGRTVPMARLPKFRPKGGSGKYSVRCNSLNAFTEVHALKTDLNI